MKTIPFYPVLGCNLPVLFLFATKQLHLFPVDSLILPMLIISDITMVFFFLFSVILRNAHKGAALTLILIATFFSPLLFEPFAVFITNAPLAITSMWGALFFGAYVVVRTKKKMVKFTKIANEVAIFGTIVELAIIGSVQVNTYLFNYPKFTYREAKLDAEHTQGQEPAPDIYYIILDGFASARTLKKEFGYDCTPFLTYLRKHGFVIPPESHSNYAITLDSLASSLNMQYLDQIPEIMGAKSVDYSLNNHLIRDNRVERYLKQRGYKLINIGSGFGPTAWNPYADKNLICSSLSETSFMMFQRTLLGMFDFTALIDELRMTRLGSFTRLIETLNMKGPKFVFAHILLPHPPYLFNAKGGWLRPDRIETNWKSRSKTSYQDQTIYTESLVSSFLEALFKKQTRPTIVIFQGDHGSASTSNLYDLHPSDEFIHERMGIFNAYLLPGEGKPDVYETITPVNSFRLIFDRYFGAHYPLLADRSFFSNYVFPFKFKDITKVLQSESATAQAQHN